MNAAKTTFVDAIADKRSVIFVRSRDVARKVWVLTNELPRPRQTKMILPGYDAFSMIKLWTQNQSGCVRGELIVQQDVITAGAHLPADQLVWIGPRDDMPLFDQCMGRRNRAGTAYVQYIFDESDIP